MTTPGLTADPLPGSADCPRVTEGLPGIGGHLLEPEDFVVDEVPAYLPEGEGEHWFVRVRKRGLTTPALVSMLARAAGVPARELGVAGRKDKHAVTTQWLSLPAEPRPPDDPRVELLEVARHRHKLRTGHLKGNVFHLRLRGVHPEAAARLPALEAELRRGIPNYYGPQRFGGAGSLEEALAFARQPKKRVRDPWFLASVAQSAVFNLWLGARVRDGLLHRALVGDVLRKRETGGLFVCTDATTDELRIAAGEVDPTGPMPGAKTMAAAGEAAEREAAASLRLDLGGDTLRALGKFAPGTRRVARLVPADLELALDGSDLRLAFFLPAGSYATTVLDELAHAPVRPGHEEST